MRTRSPSEGGKVRRVRGLGLFVARLGRDLFFLVLLFPPPATPEQVGGEDQEHQGDDGVAEGLGDGQKFAPVRAEDVTDERVGDGPHGGGREVVGQELVVLHPAHPGEQGGHAAQAGPEAADEDHLPAVSLEVVFHLLQALLADQEVEKAHLEDAVDQGPPSDAPDPVDCVVRDQGPREPGEHHQRESEPPDVGQPSPGEEDHVPRGRQPEVVQRSPYKDHDVTVGEQQAGDEAQDALRGVRDGCDEVREVRHEPKCYITTLPRRLTRAGGAAMLPGRTGRGRQGYRKPVRVRRGPATVTGERTRTREPLPRRSRAGRLEGERRSGSQETGPPPVINPTGARTPRRRSLWTGLWGRPLSPSGWRSSLSRSSPFSSITAPCSRPS